MLCTRVYVFPRIKELCTSLVISTGDPGVKSRHPYSHLSKSVPAVMGMGGGSVYGGADYPRIAIHGWPPERSRRPPSDVTMG